MSWMLTFTGKKFHPSEVSHGDIDIVDIAHALSHIPRFAGHTPKPYSVAQHSVIVTAIVTAMGGSREERLEALLHDATEAYIMDMPMPVKRLPELSGYRALEKRLGFAIMERFGVHNTSEKIKRADMIALATEARDFMGNPTDWEVIANVKPLSYPLECLSPAEAKAAFLELFIELTTDFSNKQGVSTDDAIQTRTVEQGRSDAKRSCSVCGHDLEGPHSYSCSGRPGKSS